MAVKKRVIFLAQRGKCRRCRKFKKFHPGTVLCDACWSSIGDYNERE